MSSKTNDESHGVIDKSLKWILNQRVGVMSYRDRLLTLKLLPLIKCQRKKFQMSDQMSEEEVSKLKVCLCMTSRLHVV